MVVRSDPFHDLDYFDQQALEAATPEVIALFAEVDATLRAAAARLIRPPRPLAPPVTGCAPDETRWAGRSSLITSAWWQAPAHSVSAVQRSPPAAVLHRPHGRR